MRIAIFYSGVIRLFRTNYSWFEKAFLYDPNNIVDVYASINTVSYKDAHEFRQLYNAKSMRIFEFGEQHMPEDYTFINRQERWIQMNAASMFYHNKCAFELMKASGVAYDVVVKSRTDFVNAGRFPYEDIEVGSGAVYIPGGATGTWADDQVAAGDMTAMERYCGVYDRIGEYVHKSGVCFHPETLLGHHLATNSYTVRDVKFTYSLDPLRH
jgi:hypothetical protein